MSDLKVYTVLENVDRAIYLLHNDMDNRSVVAAQLRGAVPKEHQRPGWDKSSAYESVTRNDLVQMLLKVRGLEIEKNKLLEELERLKRRGVSPQVNPDDMFGGEACDDV